ncbi:hypothetical protein Cylst_5189 [Cylindrospermum stagnale PCC 7417]|uniref:Uncharacterized protein n=1 Tax=Cylindrospermum stagnale PCC 7417 TaxID=56107 RepID=K9X446_9NOST|nr:hypothetical protein [Cylindrospermum stagnale]AFZ27228.1 hypothetical protein Cylst_5189 [Cylindrospermum stagnale PCC 7417]
MINLSLKKLKVLSLASLLTILASSTASAEPYYHTFRIYVAGPDAGTVIYHTDSPYKGNQFPHKACGVIIHYPIQDPKDPEALWYWAKNGNTAMTQAELPGNGIKTEQLKFTGPYEGCKQSPPIFTTPATPDGNAPEKAEVLVIQADPTDIEWLDSHYEPIPPIPHYNPWEHGPKDFADPCKEKEFCEPMPTPPCSDLSASLFDCKPSLRTNETETGKNGVKRSGRVNSSKQNLKFLQ